MTKHIMIDTETWGKRAGCDARSIGAVVFDPTTGHVATRGSAGTFYTALENRVDFPYEWGDRPGQPPRKYKLWRDPETEAWWSEQSEEAQAAFANPVDLRDGLILLSTWLETVTTPSIGGNLIMHFNPVPMHKREHVRLWGHGAGFDLPIIEAWYHACDLPVPWHYRAPRDTRTAFDMAGIDDHSAWLNQHAEVGAIAHHALDDALCQARAVCGAYGQRIPHDVLSHRSAWREALTIARDKDEITDADRSYWQHEIDAFDQTFDLLAKTAGNGNQA